MNEDGNGICNLDFNTCTENSKFMPEKHWIERKSTQRSEKYFFLRNPFKPFQKLPRNLKIALLNPHWHELWQQEKCSSLAPPWCIFYKTEGAWQGVKLTLLM